jgi:hypothetical protein
MLVGVDLAVGPGQEESIQVVEQKSLILTLN